MFLSKYKISGEIKNHKSIIYGSNNHFFISKFLMNFSILIIMYKIVYPNIFINLFIR